MHKLIRTNTFVVAFVALAATAAVAPAASFAAKNPWPQRMELTGPSGSAFGYAVAINGSTMAVEEPYANNDNGAVDIYMKMGKGWTKQTQISVAAPSGADVHGFGESLAMPDDHTLVVGSPYEQGYAGAVYVFVKSGNTWSLQTKITDPNATGFDYFGEAVVASGNGFLAGGDESGTGAVYAYAPMGGNHSWMLQQTVTAADGANGDAFGFSLAVDGSTLVVGAPYRAGFSGAFYTFMKSGNGWAQHSETADPGAPAQDLFGTSVAIDNPSIVVGAPYTTNGTAYVYKQSGPGWTQQAVLTASDGASGDQFGYPVAIHEQTIVIGGSNHTTTQGGAGAGAAYVYMPGKPNTWVQQSELIPSDSYSGAFFGWPTITFDGPDIVISAPYTPTGSLYWFGP